MFQDQCFRKYRPTLLHLSFVLCNLPCIPDGVVAKTVRSDHVVVVGAVHGIGLLQDGIQVVDSGIVDQ